MSNRLASLGPSLGFFLRHPMARRQPARTALRILGWQLNSRRDRDSRVPWVGGTTLVARRGMGGATGSIYYGLYEYADMGFLLHFLRPGDGFVDAGANVGVFTVLAAGAAGARVTAVEPAAAALAALGRNVDANGLAGQVRIINAALGAAAGRVRMTVGLDTLNRVAADGDTATREVEMTTLDALDVRPAAIKMDLEGYEGEALAGAVATLAAPGLKAVITEANDPVTSGLLEAAGFRRHAYDPATRQLDKDASTHFGHNGLYLRDMDSVRDRIAAAPAIDVYGTEL